MKHLLMVILFLTAMGAYADIDYVSDYHSQPSSEEITQNRACFKELEKAGCGDPGEDPHQFRSCMSSVYPTLPESCQKLMTKLYKK